jgi:hypothetical protein
MEWSLIKWMVKHSQITNFCIVIRNSRRYRHWQKERILRRRNKAEDGGTGRRQEVLLLSEGGTLLLIISGVTTKQLLHWRMSSSGMWRRVDLVSRRFGGRSVHTRSARYHISEDGILRSHRRENLKSYHSYTAYNSYKCYRTCLRFQLEYNNSYWNSSIVAVISSRYNEAWWLISLLVWETVLNQMSLCCRWSFIPNTGQELRSSRWLAPQVYRRSLTITKSRRWNKLKSYVDRRGRDCYVYAQLLKNTAGRSPQASWFFKMAVRYSEVFSLYQNTSFQFFLMGFGAFATASCKKCARCPSACNCWRIAERIFTNIGTFEVLLNFVYTFHL